MLLLSPPTQIADAGWLLSLHSLCPAGDAGWLPRRRTGGLAADPRQRVGMDLVPVDAARPLAKQGPFHLLINKLYGDGWRAQL